jgi:hypothetical protein
MNDIFETWKKQKFIIPTEIKDYELTVVLTDAMYWSDNYYELCQWCKENNCDPKGMTVDIPDKQTLTLFCLKWA